MKRLSQKDLIIVLGVAVAVIIIITSIYFKETQPHNATQFPEKKVKPTVLIKKVLEKLAPKAHI